MVTLTATVGNVNLLRLLVSAGADPRQRIPGWWQNHHSYHPSKRSWQKLTACSVRFPAKKMVANMTRNSHCPDVSMHPNCFLGQDVQPPGSPNKIHLRTSNGLLPLDVAAAYPSGSKKQVIEFLKDPVKPMAMRELLGFGQNQDI